MEKRCKTARVKNQPKIIVVTGAESTGKSTLTEALAAHFNVPFIPEIARNVVEQLQHKYTYSDVETIARKQIEMLNRLRTGNHPFLIADTWLIVTKIWFDVVFQKEPDWLDAEIRNTKIDLFLVCDIDIPWVADPVRENGGEMRKILHQKYIDTISAYNFNYKLVTGNNKIRTLNALHFLNEME